MNDNENESQTPKEIIEDQSNQIAENIDEQNAEQDEPIESENAERDSRFKEGQDITFLNVRFAGNARSFPFLLGSKIFHYGQKVVAMSDRGMTVGYINSFPYTKPFEKSMLPLRTISKVATEEDLQKERDLIAEEKRAERICVDLIERHKLDMNLTHVEFMQFGKKAVFFFTAPNRVDFRNLVKDLVAQLKMRIELRQISVRDRAAALGAIGPCGLQTCCSSFHKNYGNVTIKMAKNQNLALMPNKINGVCGQIKCCIKYEHELYAEKRKKLPKENGLIQTVNGDKGKVLKLNILAEEFEMITCEGKIRRYTADQFKEGTRLPDDWKMPEQFENNIVNETKELIGAKLIASNAAPIVASSDDLESTSQPEVNQEELATEQQASATETPAQEERHPHPHHRPRHQNQGQRQGQNQGQRNDNRRGPPQQGRPNRPHQNNNRPRPNNPQGGGSGNQGQGGNKPQG